MKIETAKSVFIRHKESSYGTFLWNNLGDLTLTSDWGSFGYSWRAFGDDFENFLIGTQPDYIISKLEQDFRVYTKRNVPKHVYQHLSTLFTEFQKALKESRS